MSKLNACEIFPSENIMTRHCDTENTGVDWPISLAGIVITFLPWLILIVLVLLGKLK